MGEVKHITIPYKPRDVFIPFHSRTARWAIGVAHRRCGKTVACINDLIKRAIQEGKTDGHYAYLAPFYSQVKSVAWDYLLRYSAPVRARANASELWVELINGAKIRLFGSDNPDALRGMYMDGVILDEYADMKPRLWGEVIRPLLADRGGWAVFIGTPKGHNEFFHLYEDAIGDDRWHVTMLKASKTGLLPPDELQDAQRSMTPEQYAQEFECSFEAAIIGAYYGRELAAASDDGRIVSVPYDPSLRVHTAWDLGISDSMTIWFFQQAGREIRFIDYYEASGHGLDHYAKELDKRGYLYGKHYAPHDIKVRELGTGKSRLEVARKLGLNFTVVRDIGIKDGIDAARLMLPRCIFDREKCGQGLEALKQYREKVDEKRGVSLGPLHDWTSHAADAFRMAAVAINEKPEIMRPSIETELHWMG